MSYDAAIKRYLAREIPLFLKDREFYKNKNHTYAEWREHHDTTKSLREGSETLFFFDTHKQVTVMLQEAQPQSESQQSETETQSE